MAAQANGRMNIAVEKLFHELADLSPEALKLYFAEHVVDQETRHEVERLLAFDSSASAFLQRDINIAASRALPELEAKGGRCVPYRVLDAVQGSEQSQGFWPAGSRVAGNRRFNIEKS
jgi:hypothetical protein